MSVDVCAVSIIECMPFDLFDQNPIPIPAWMPIPTATSDQRLSTVYQLEVSGNSGSISLPAADRVHR